MIVAAHHLRFSPCVQGIPAPRGSAAILVRNRGPRCLPYRTSPSSSNVTGFGPTTASLAVFVVREWFHWLSSMCEPCKTKFAASLSLVVSWTRLTAVRHISRCRRIWEPGRLKSLRPGNRFVGGIDDCCSPLHLGLVLMVLPPVPADSPTGRRNLSSEQRPDPKSVRASWTFA